NRHKLLKLAGLARLKQLDLHQIVLKKSVFLPFFVLDSLKIRAYYARRVEKSGRKWANLSSLCLTSKVLLELLSTWRPIPAARNSMLRGNYTARMDSKGRLKIPTPFRRFIEEKHGADLYVTSLTGENVRIYPLPEWESIEQR